MEWRYDFYNMPKDDRWILVWLHARHKLPKFPDLVYRNDGNEWVGTDGVRYTASAFEAWCEVEAPGSN